MKSNYMYNLDLIILPTLTGGWALYSFGELTGMGAALKGHSGHSTRFSL